MKTNLHIRSLLGPALAAVVAAGCASVKPGISDGTTFPSEGQTVTPVPATYTVSSQTEIMKISLKVDPADEKAAGFASQVRETAIGALRDRKFKIVTDGTEDIRLGIKAGTSLYDNSADTYYTLDGTAAMRLDDAVNGRLLAEETIRGRNKASLGMEKAVRDVAEAMKPAIVSWIAAKVTPEQIPLEARTLRITNTDRYNGGESVFIQDFVQAMSKMDGVLRCETEARDGAAKTAAFRVLYRREKYPQGFIHAVVNQNPAFNLVLQ
jgi:hypothetical protein